MTNEAKAYDFTYQISRYHEDWSPMAVYIPSNDVLFKMMRATIGVTRVEDLWIYNPGYSSYLQTGSVEDNIDREVDLATIDDVVDGGDG